MRAPHLVLLAIALISDANATDSKVCAGCHAEIYRNYSGTPMARTSGVVVRVTSPFSNEAEFTDKASGTLFRR